MGYSFPRGLVDATNGQLHGGLETAWAIHERNHYARIPARGGGDISMRWSTRAWQLQVHLAPLNSLWRPK